MFSALCLTLSAVILYFVLRYRVHIHVTYSPRTKTQNAPRNDRTTGTTIDKTTAATQPRRRPRASDDHAQNPGDDDDQRSTGKRIPRSSRALRMAAGPQQTPAPKVVDLENKARRQDLVSALKHQGCSPLAARSAAELAMSHQDPDLESALRRAIDYAREAA